MIRVQGEGPALDHVLEVPDVLEGTKQLPVIWRPELLVRLQL